MTRRLRGVRARTVKTRRRALAAVLPLFASLACFAALSSAAQVDIGVRYTPQQRRAAGELGYALGVALNMYENPPVCLRMRPGGRIVAEVLGREELPRVRRALGELHIEATTNVTTIAAYNAGVRKLARRLSAAKPRRFKYLRVGYRQIETLSRSGDLDFEPQCPPVSVTQPALHPKAGSQAEEDAWAQAAERQYGGDRVETSCCDLPERRSIHLDSFRRAAPARSSPPTAADAAAGRGHGAMCGPRAAQTVKLSITIRVYRVPTHSRLAPDLEYACWRHGGRASLRLGYAGSFGFDAAHTTLLKLAPQTGPQPSSVVAWVQRTEGHSNSMSIRSGDVRTGKLIHETAPPGEGDTLDTLERGYFIVTPSGSLAWFGRGGPVNAKGEHTGPEGVWTLDAQGEHLLAAGEWIAKPLKWSAGTLYWTLEGPPIRTSPLQ
jgi:hypothetical protein